MLKIAAQPQRAEAPQKFSKDFIDRVLANTDIVDVVRQAVDLKSGGHNLFGLCPFHGEKSPSFSVSPQKQIYHCFGCGANGDAVGFLMEHAALSFREAVTELAEAARIPIPTDMPGGAQVASVDLSAMVATNERAAAFFRHCLKHTEAARKYVVGRGITREAAARFLIGFAPPEWQALEEPFPDYATSTTLTDLGLVIEKDGRRYDRFRGRLMFGIRDARGRIMGWGGRSIDGSEPKYLNSPQSALFDKSSQLFGIFEAREAIRRTKQVVVTEGYIDTVANSMAGVEQTVATMGTACTAQHMERLVALAPEVVFSFDGDKAGLAAAWKSLKICLPFATDQRSFRFLLLPPGMDPDEVIKERGIDAYKDMLAKALSLSGFMLTHLAEINDHLKTPENKAKFLSDGGELVRQMPAGGNLARILRKELQKAADSSGPDLTAVQQVSVRERLDARTRTGPWMTLAQAVQTQMRTAAGVADAILELLPQNLQDDFFASNFKAFPEAQQCFWRALDAAILCEDPQDQETDISLAMRNLLQAGVAAVRAQLRKDERAAARQAFRAGTTTEEDYLGGVEVAQREDGMATPRN